MWRVTLKGVAGHSVRYALTALAVMLGVTFMASTLVLTDTISHTFEQSIAKLPQVSASTAVHAATVGAYGQSAGVVAADVAEAGKLFNLGVTHGNIADMTARDIAVSTQVAKQHHLGLGSPVVLSFPLPAERRFMWTRSTASATYRVTTCWLSPLWLSIFLSTLTTRSTSSSPPAYQRLPDTRR